MSVASGGCSGIDATASAPATVEVTGWSGSIVPSSGNYSRIPRIPIKDFHQGLSML